MISLAIGFSWITQAPFIGRFITPSPKDNNGFGKMMATCFRLVDERAASPADQRSNMLASFMRYSSAGDELRTEVLEQIIAGSDTTAGHSWRSSAPHDESPCLPQHTARDRRAPQPCS